MQPYEDAIRLFVVDEETGKPLQGVVVRTFAGLPGEQESRIAATQTDANGYTSFKFHPAKLAGASQVTIVCGVGTKPLVLDVAALGGPAGARTIPVNAAAALQAAESGLPSVIAPDVVDATVSPASIAVPPSVGLCSLITPTTMAHRRFRMFQVEADICDPTEVVCGNRNRFDVVRGTIREYETIWYSLGTSLGDLLNSITLAPCEQVNIAVIDWMRREVAAQTTATDVRQSATQDMSHDRLVNETMDMSTRSWSIAAGGAFQEGAKIPVDGIDITSKISAGIAGGFSDSQIAGATTSKLSEHIRQASTFVSSTRTSVVFQTVDEEHQTYQTRCLSNNNHCATLTFVYYQINRNYFVQTSYLGKRDVVLVRYPNPDFDAERAFCNKEVLAEKLLDASLRDCFDKLGDALYCCEPSKPNDVSIESIELKVTVGTNHNAQDLTIILLTTAGAVLLPMIGTIGWLSGQQQSVTITPPAGVHPQNITGIQLHVFGGLGAFLMFTSFELTYAINGGSSPLTVYSTQTPFVVLGPWSTEVKAELPQVQPTNECLESSCCVKKLIAHLNCESHKRYYNALVWMAENPNDRVARWSCCAPHGIIADIENTPITTYGDFVVFPAANSQLDPDPSVPPVDDLVTLPTPGVYSEGILGKCNTCEKLQADRFWDWKRSPCPDCSKAITPITPQPGVKPSDLKTDAVSNLITFASVPSAPESVLKALVESVFSKAASGSTDAQAILTKLLDLLKDAATPPKSGG